MTGLRRGQPTALALLLAAAACTTSNHVVGTPPEQTTDQASPRRTRTDTERAEAIRRHQEAAARAEPAVEQPAPEDPRVGVATTHVFHRPDCKLLSGVATSDQIRFTSPWDALDSRYAPCPECRPFQ
jgi:anti-sigma factor RsiW